MNKPEVQIDAGGGCIRGEVLVLAPAAAVFAHVAELRNMESWWPEHRRYRRLTGDGGAGTRYWWIYSVLGLPVLGTTRIEEREAPVRLVYQTGLTAMRVRMAYDFAQEGAGTRVRVQMRTPAARLPAFARRASAELLRSLGLLRAECAG